jgi:hypothetical protein
LKNQNLSPGCIPRIFNKAGASISDDEIREGVLILRNKSLKLKTVVDNANLLNYAVSSENISERIKIQTENVLHLKANVGIFRRNKKRPEKQSHRRHFAKIIFKIQI